MKSALKVGDVGPCYTRQAGIDFSDPKWEVLYSAESLDASTQYILRRDLTDFQVAPYADPANGVAAVWVFDGLGRRGDRAAPNTVGAGDIITVTAPAGPAGTVRQYLYMTKAADPTGVAYLVAEGPTGFLSGGLAIGDDSVTPAAGVIITGLGTANGAGNDLELVRPAPTLDQSVTFGEVSPIGVSVTSSEVVSSPATGKLTVGDHQFEIVNARTPESSAPLSGQFELIYRDRTTGYEHTNPSASFEEFEIYDDVS